MSAARDSLFPLRLRARLRYRWQRGIRIAPISTARSFGWCDWSPIVLDFGYLRFNRWWWHNLHCHFAWVFRLHYGFWPRYHPKGKDDERRWPGV